MQGIDLETISKPELRAALKASLERIHDLCGTVERLLRQARPASIRHVSHEDDAVPSGWAEQHGIHIPRADGIFDSTTAWVRVSHGVVTGAGLKNQSILSMMISLRLVDEGEERSAMLAGDVGKLFRMGANSFLMAYMARFEVCGLNVALYNERMRAEKIDEQGRPAA